MSVLVSCTNCQAALNVKPEFIGKKIRCPKCQTIFVSTGSPTSHSQTAKTSGKSNTPVANSTGPSASSKTNTVSPYENLAASLMSTPNQPAAPTTPANPPSTPYNSAPSATTPSYPAAAGSRSAYSNTYRGQQPVRPQAQLTPEDVNSVKTGGYMIAFGLATLILPSLGLQIKGLHLLGPIAGVIGSFVALIGAAFLGIGYRQSTIKMLLAGGLPGLFFLLCLLNAGLISYNEFAPAGKRIQLAQMFGGSGGQPNNGTKMPGGETADRYISQMAEDRKPPINGPIPTSNSTTSNPFESSPGFAERTGNKTGANPQSSSASKPPTVNSPSVKSPPAAALVEMETTYFDGYACKVDFPKTAETRWGNIPNVSGDIASQEKFAELGKGLTIQAGVAELKPDQAQSLLSAARHALIANFILGQYEMTSLEKKQVLGAKFPYAEISGRDRRGERVVRIRVLVDEFNMMWAVVSGSKTDVNSETANRFFDSFGPLSGSEIPTNEGPLWTDALKQVLLTNPSAPAIASKRENETDNPFGGNSTNPFQKNDGMDLAKKFSESHRMKIVQKQAELRMAMIQTFGFESIRSCSPEFMTETAGNANDGNPEIYVHADRQPMVGIDFDWDSDGLSFEAMVPVYGAFDSNRLTANDGYAVAGLNVYAQDRLMGLQPIFMKIKGKTFDKNDTYNGDWYGLEPPEGKVIQLGGDGRPVYGIWYSGTFKIESFALIIEKQ